MLKLNTALDVTKALRCYLRIVVSILCANEKLLN